MPGMVRRSTELLAATLAVMLWGCDACPDAHKDAVGAWDDVVGYALTVAASWGEIEVKDLDKGKNGMSETAARERQRWAEALDKAKRGKAAVAGLTGDYVAVSNQMAEELKVYEPPTNDADWKAKLGAAKNATYLAQSACGRSH